MAYMEEIMSKHINWLRGDVLVTHTSNMWFEGQYKGKLIFNCNEYHLEFSPHQVVQMIRLAEWRQIKNP